LNQPLKGIRILDLTRILAGPFATMILADLGAEVIKVEAPGRGDDTRQWGPPFQQGESTYFLSINRSKYGVSLNFKHPKGKELLFRLIERADILIENFRFGTLDRLGLGYKDLAVRFPRLIYCSITGYGHTGPRRHDPGFDVIIQGESGLMSVTGSPDGPPYKVGASIADIAAGMYAVQGVLAALYQREQTGRGQKVDIALLDSIVSALNYQTAMYLIAGCLPQRMGNRHPNIAPYETFEAADGHFIVAVANNPHWHLFCEAVNLRDLEQDPRYREVPDRVRNYDPLRKCLADHFRLQPAAYWLDRLRKAGLPCGEVRTVSQALEEPQLAARGMILEMPHSKAGKIRVTGSPLKMSASVPAPATAPPTHGEHNREVFCGMLGLSGAEYESLAQDRVF
jgi:crotonobetainyl-CoA:carnitine CoA-transferase CaiB-like acyl-CoA transferase